MLGRRDVTPVSEDTCAVSIVKEDSNGKSIQPHIDRQHVKENKNIPDDRNNEVSFFGINRSFLHCRSSFRNAARHDCLSCC